MDADIYVARWTIIIRDEDAQGQTPAWKEALPPGTTFNIARDGFGTYWYLPSPGTRAPMNQSFKLTPSAEQHGSFEVGVLLPGTLCADLGGKVGKLYFAVNLVDGRHRIISLSQSHGGLHGVG